MVRGENFVWVYKVEEELDFRLVWDIIVERGWGAITC